ncbi:MAG: ATP-binding protein [Balneolaceae bacterium]|nr:ATP-binding protein [Balneolaceae bacterium]
MKTLWHAYKSTIYTHCTETGISRNSVPYWKNRLFAATVLFTIPLSFITLIPGIYMGYTLWLVGLLVSDLIAVLTILFVAFVPGISVFARKILFNLAMYQTSVVLLHYLGSNGPGLLYLLAITIFVLLSLDQWYGYLTFILNALVCIFFGAAIHYGFASHVLMGEYQLDAWIGVSSNLVFLSGIAVFLVPKLFDGLQASFEEQEDLQKELKESVENLNDKNQELEQFAYTISHDLKEPLRMVRSFMKLLKNKYSNKLDEKAHEYIHYAVDGAERMSINIDDLLEYSRIGRKYTTVEKTDLNHLLDEVLQNLQVDIKDKNAKITAAGLPVLPVVPVAVKMLFQNLISNGLKYQPKDNRPEIHITVEEQGETWKFSFSDNGIGINPKYHDQIFAVFKRLHTRNEYSGSGMGLAISKKIVEQHDGSIWVESRGNEGSTFSFTISKHYLKEKR